MFQSMCQTQLYLSHISRMYASIQGYKYAKYEIMPMCKYASLQVCKNANMQAFNYANMQICKYARTPTATPPCSSCGGENYGPCPDSVCFGCISPLKIISSPSRTPPGTPPPLQGKHWLLGNMPSTIRGQL